MNEKMNEKQLARVAFWSDSDSRENNANIQATYYGKPAKYPQSLPAQEQARETLRQILGNARIFPARFGGTDSLTDEQFCEGTEIYYYNQDVKLTLVTAAIDELLS